MNYKHYVEAYKKTDEGYKKLCRSISAHIVGKKNTKYTNVKNIKLVKKKAELSVMETFNIKAQLILDDPKKRMLSDGHAAAFRYASTDKSVATVTKKGKATAKSTGTCYIWVYAKNGYAKKIKVTVK